MRKPALLAALSASVLAMSTASSFADYTLNILHINDWHSRIESNNAFESTCSDKDEGEGKCFGGAARLVTAIADRRKALDGQNTLLLNGGDNFQGSLFYATYKGAAEAEFLNLMKFDAMTVGNHEFDDGEPALKTFLDAVKFPVLSVNVKAASASTIVDRIKPSIVLDVGGQKVGIVGAVTTDTPEIASPGPNITIEDDIATITAEVKRLEGEGVNKIIALTHVGYVRDMEMIAKIPGVDVVVGGHSHTLLHNSDAKAAGPYPTMIDNPGGYKVPVTQAASYSKYLGEFSVTFDDSGVVKEAKGDPLILDKAITPDPAVLARIKELGAPIEELKQKEVSETTAVIDGDRNSCRAKECTMGNIIADAMIDRVKDQGVTIAIQNGGGIRASIDQGVITMGEVLTVLPFQNTLATFQLTGKEIVAALEHGVSAIEEGKGQFPQVSGLKYTFDRSLPANSGRIKSVEVQDNGAWAPIDEAKTYTLATNNFVRAGGDGYKSFASAQNAYDFGPSLEQVVADYLAARRPFTPAIEGRITDVTPAEFVKAETEKKAAAAAEKKAADEKAAADKAAADKAAAAGTTPASGTTASGTAPASGTAASGTAASGTAPASSAVSSGGATGAGTVPALPSASTEIANTPPKVDTAPSAAAAPATPAPAPAPSTAAAPTTPAPAPAASAAEPAGKSHVIVRGDTYWDLAETFYGDGEKWQSIAAANPDQKERDLTIGATLTIPAAN